MAEQLSMFSTTASLDSIADDTPTSTALTEVEYEALDYQLADLLVELNDFKAEDETQRKAMNKILRHCTLEISKNTREGQIAKAVTQDQQSILLQTTVVGKAGDYKPLIIDAGYVYLNRYWQYQQRLADQINTRIKNTQSLSEDQQQRAQTRIAEYFKDQSDSESDSANINWQKRAAELALENRFLIVSGGPGTGKTTTITRLLALLIEQRRMFNVDDATTTSAKSADIIEVSVSNNETASSLKKGGGVTSTSSMHRILTNYNILLAAPTGKAAIRMLDSIRGVSQSLQNDLGVDENVIAQMPTQANTLHKLLGYKPHSAQFKHNHENPLNADVVLVDEASMIDIALMSKLLDAVPEHAKLILIGDKDQLASVETGSVFADICQGLKDSENLVTLKKNWRFAADSDIGQCAIAANQGDSNALLTILNDTHRSNAELIAPASIRDANLIKPWYNYFKVLHHPDSSLNKIFDAFNQYRILCALRRGLNGSQTMSDRIETALELQGLITRRRNQQARNQQSSWYHGRPIMISQNSYNRGLFNGDTGITLIRGGELKVYFPMSDGEFKSFSPIRLPAHETTWAMTIHKSQGSEFNQVLLVLPQEEMPLLTRQLIYTGITRAKQQVSIVASEDVLLAGVKAEVVKATRIDQRIKCIKK